MARLNGEGPGAGNGSRCRRGTQDAPDRANCGVRSPRPRLRRESVQRRILCRQWRAGPLLQVHRLDRCTD